MIHKLKDHNPRGWAKKFAWLPTRVTFNGHDYRIWLIDYWVRKDDGYDHEGIHYWKTASYSLIEPKVKNGHK